MCFSVSLSLSLLQQREKIHRSRRTEREKESGCCQKLRLFKGCLPNTPTPHIPLQVSSSRRNFIRAGFLYTLISPEGTSHYYRCEGGGGGGGAGYGGTFSFEVHQCCYALPPPPPHPTTHTHTSRPGTFS